MGWSSHIQRLRWSNSYKPLGRWAQLRNKYRHCMGKTELPPPRHEFWHKFILSHFGFWEREHTDEIAVPWTSKTQYINISQSFLLLTPTGRVFEPLRWLLRAPLNHSATWDPTDKAAHSNTIITIDVQTTQIRCGTFHAASHIHVIHI